MSDLPARVRAAYERCKLFPEVKRNLTPDVLMVLNEWAEYVAIPRAEE